MISWIKNRYRKYKIFSLSFKDKGDVKDFQNEIETIIEENWKLNETEAKILLEYYVYMQSNINRKRAKYLLGKKAEIVEDCISYRKLTNLLEYNDSLINLLKAKLGSEYYCPNCGHEIQRNNKYCPECGKCIKKELN